MITKNTGSARRRLRKPYLARGEQPRASPSRTARFGSGTVRNRSVAMARYGASLGSSRSSATARLSPPRTTASSRGRAGPRRPARPDPERVRQAPAVRRARPARLARWPRLRAGPRWRASCCYPGCPAAEDGDRRVRRRVKRLVRLLFPAAREAVLRPAARRAAAVHQARADLRVGERRRVAGEHPGRVPAEADQQDADGARRPGVRGDHRGDLARLGEPWRQRKRFRVTAGGTPRPRRPAR